MSRAASWLDVVIEHGHFPAFFYACIDARLAIEHLIFEQLCITAGKRLGENEYNRCLKNQGNSDRLIKQLVPDYEEWQAFSKLAASLSPGAPSVNRWNIKDLRKSWGHLSKYLHWGGAYPQTTEDPSWKATAIEEVMDIILPLWQKICSGRSGVIRLETMPPAVKEIWEEFRAGKIDFESARNRLVDWQSQTLSSG